MKDVIKKISIIFAVLIGICLIGLIIIFIFFPGLDVYLYAKKNCPYINEQIQEYEYYDVEVPDSFVKVKAGDLYISGPAESIKYTTGSDSGIIFKNSKENLMVMYSSAPNDNIDFTYDIATKYNNDDHKHFFDSVGYDMPVTNRDMKVFLRDGLDLKKSLKLRGKDKKIFKEMADSLKLVSEIETLYHFEHNNAEGYICKVSSGKQRTMWNADIYTGNNGETETIIAITHNDVETVKQIIASIELAQ